MSGLSSHNANLIADRCRQAVQVRQRGLHRCLPPQAQLRCAPLRPLDLKQALHTPGVVMGVEAGGRSLAVLIPNSVLAEAWKGEAVENDQRWQSLAAELADQLLPEDVAVGRVQATAVDDLANALRHGQPEPDAVVLEVEVSSAGGTGPSGLQTPAPDDAGTKADAGDAGTTGADASQAAEPNEPAAPQTPPTNATGTPPKNVASSGAPALSGDDSPAPSSDAPSPGPTADQARAGGELEPPVSASVYLVWPLRRFPAEPGAGRGSSDGSKTGASAEPAAMADHLDEVKKLPVQVIVRLAEKKMPVSQLVDLAPGSLLMFDKSCDELLDLYVNNQLLCRGEAVKIGEKFGLKINEIPARIVREEKVIHL